MFMLRSIPQVTCYSAVDGNNWFKLEAPPSSRKDRTHFIKHDDVVRIKHVLTEKYLTVYNGVESVSHELADLVSFYLVHNHTN